VLDNTGANAQQSQAFNCELPRVLMLTPEGLLPMDRRSRVYPDDRKELTAMH